MQCQPRKDSLLNFPISAVPRPLSAGACPATTPDACFLWGGQAYPAPFTVLQRAPAFPARCSLAALHIPGLAQLPCSAALPSPPRAALPWRQLPGVLGTWLWQQAPSSWHWALRVGAQGHPHVPGNAPQLFAVFSHTAKQIYQGLVFSPLPSLSYCACFIGNLFVSHDEGEKNLES